MRAPGTSTVRRLEGRRAGGLTGLKGRRYYGIDQPPLLMKFAVPLKPYTLRKTTFRSALRWQKAGPRQKPEGGGPMSGGGGGGLHVPLQQFGSPHFVGVLEFNLVCSLVLVVPFQVRSGGLF